MNRRDKRRAGAHRAESAQKSHQAYLDYQITDDFYNQRVHVCPKEVVDEINRKDSKGHFIGYYMYGNYHVGGSFFLKGSAEEFSNSTQAKIDHELNTRRY